jgi:hypothetical protein
LILLLWFPYEINGDPEDDDDDDEDKDATGDSQDEIDIGSSVQPTSQIFSTLYSKFTWMHPLFDVFSYLHKYPGIAFLIWVKGFSAASWGALSVVWLRCNVPLLDDNTLSANAMTMAQAEVELIDDEFRIHGSSSMPLGFLYAFCGLSM